MQEFKNGSDHEVVASYSGLYEEGEVEHFLIQTAKILKLNSF